ncbi:MAG: alpha/beta fold hydrolase [Mogibacterium sp.]|nr:alpha/beta fold hydrolase [Mogibacterium sp.]
MKKEDFYYPSSDGRTKIHARSWTPDGEPKAVLQILHGMVEFIGRYGDFAAFLADHGYVVVGNDHLGHGESVVTDEDHGYFGENGNAHVIQDIDRLRNMTSEKYPGLPYFMLGHSMGSFLVRQYITDHAAGLRGVIIMGTGWQPGAALTAGKALSSLIGKVKGKRYRSTFINNMAIGAYNKQFKNPRTAADWLTRDEEIVDWYLNEDWCTFMFTVDGYNNMFKGMQVAHDKKKMAGLPEGLPLLIVSGAEDPVGGNGKGVRQTYEAYKKYSPCSVDIMLYENDRHEILNELDRAQVYEDLLAWLDDKI